MLTTALLWTLAAAVPVPAEPAAPVVNHIIWLAGDAVPVGAGAAAARPSDRVIDVIAERMPGVSHERVIANAKRSWTLIQRGDPVCHAGTVRTAEREALAYFSNTLAVPPQQLIVRRDRVAALPLDANGHVDLAAVLADARLQGLVVQGRSYGAALDALLARRPAQTGLRDITAADFGSNVLAMLRQQRIDYTVEYPILLAAAAPQRGDDAADLVGVPIRGNSDLVVIGVACPRNAWGRAAIRLVDRALGTPQAAAVLRGHLQAEMTADDQRRYRAALDDFFRRRSQPSPGL